MKKRAHPLITLSLFTLTIVGSVAWFMNPPIITKGDTEVATSTQQEEPKLQQGKNVVIHLTTMELELRDGETVLKVLPLLSQGKPGSYYETIGGSYTSDYKIPLHFSSIGHVYMPFSVHLFGNYFIHGVPYYPNGNKVSSTYSGGCIRLTDDNAEILYTFVERGTPIIITRDSTSSFTPTKKVPITITSIEMTRMMVATISLEALTQDNEIAGIDTADQTTRRKLLPELLIGKNDEVALLYADSIGQKNFISLMNQKAESLGLTNTTFTDVTSPVATTQEDYERFMLYITTYKSYIRTVQQ